MVPLIAVTWRKGWVCHAHRHDVVKVVSGGWSGGWCPGRRYDVAKVVSGGYLLTCFLSLPVRHRDMVKGVSEGGWLPTCRCDVADVVSGKLLAVMI